MEEIELTHLESILNEYAEKFAALVKEKLAEKDRKGWNKVASGDLYRSIRGWVDNVNKSNTLFKVYIKSEDYLKYVENDTRPHWPPFEPILKWVGEKKLPTRESTGDRSLPTESQLAYLVQRKISREGTEGRPVIARTQGELNEIYLPKFQEALMEDIMDYLPIIKISIEFK